MYTGVSSSPMMSTECFNYDFLSMETLPKWKDMFLPALERILKQVHPSLMATRESVEKVEVLIIQVLACLLGGGPPPHSINDISDRVHKKLPDPINTWAVCDANIAIERLKRDKKGGTVGLLMPADKLHQMLVKEVFCHKIDYQITVFVTAVLEYVAADILKLIGNYVKNIRHQEITLPDVDVALCADKVLMNMLFDDDDDHVASIHVPMANEKSLSSLSYEEIVKDLILVENQYLRELNMIIKVFQDAVEKMTSAKEVNMEEIFDLVSDMHELTLNLISSLEDTLEATKEGEAVLIGSCFEDFMEGMEFNVYQKYSFLVLDTNIHVKWVEECSKLPLHMLTGRGLKECIKYVLPSLLLDPFYHFIYYCDILKILMSKSRDDEDVELLRQSLNSLNIIRANTDMDRKLASKAHFKKRRRSVEKLEEVQRSIDGWDGKNINQICNDYITEGFLQKVSGRRMSDRYVFLLDGIVVLTKKVNPVARRSVVSSSQSPFDFKLKEKFFVRKIEVVDKEDTEDLKNAFEIYSTHQKQQSHITLLAKNHEDKIHWLSAFFYLLNKSMLERLLDSKLKEEEKRQPLKLPSPDQYRFAIEDSDDNIVFEDNGGGSNTSSNDIPVIRGGIIIKLVERLTYHSYFDPKFTKTFLTTYRTFCKPKELLSLLIERFNIPEPNSSNVERDSMKKFRNSFIKPISFRVLNVLRQWVDHHWYDFESDKALYDQLVQFLEESVKGKVLKKWVETINKVLARKLNSSTEKSKQITFVSPPPPVEWHISKNPAEFDIMNLHPIEIARQVTLLEFEIFKTIKSSEMVGAVWTKKDKQVTSPNLLKMIHHTTKFTFWLEKCIIETDNFEERVAVMSRVLEILVVFQELNNFNGVVEVHSALSSASVHRLEHTFEEVDKKSPKLMKALEEAKELNEDRFKGYIKRLRSINPPCIPFLGMYLTNILYLEEGNPDFLTNRPQGFINFSKRRKVAEITAEIQQYQDQPYCLNLEPQIRAFIESLNPLGNMTEVEFDDHLYERSLFIEPRNSKPAKLDKKRDYSLKSPGTKPSSSLNSSSSSLPHRSSATFLNSIKNHPRSSHTPSVTNQGASLDESLEGDSPTDSGSPISCSTHYSSGEDVGDGKDVADDRSLVVPSGNFLCQSFDSLQTNSLSGSTRTLCSSNTLVHSPQPAVSRSPTSEGRSPADVSSSPPPLPPRHASRVRRHNHSQSPSLPQSGLVGGNATTRFPFPPRKSCFDEPPPALPPRENPGRPPPPVPPRRSEHFLPQFQHHLAGSPLSVDFANFYCEFQRPPLTPVPVNGYRDSAAEGNADDPDEHVPAIPPKNYRSYSGGS